MDRTLAFRRGLLARLLQASVVSLPVAAAALSGACGTGGSGGSGSGGGGTTQTKQGCFPFPQQGTGGGGTGGGGTGDAGAGVCPTKAEAPMYLGSQLGPCNTIVSDGTFNGAECCYEIEGTQCLGTGRPFLDRGRARTAAARRAGEAWGSERGAPLAGELAAELRARLAAAWAADGLMEHASIASFGRFAFELMAVGAPADLVAEAHRAAVDEVEHARLCLALAASYGGEPVAPAPFPFEGRVEVSADLASIAARAAREGCIGETLASIQAAEQLARAEDPRVREALAVIVEDEARHAELSWRFVAWALAQGGPEVRAAVARAFAGAVPLPQGEALPPEMTAHGRLDPSVLRAVVLCAIDDVVRPCAERLLAAA
jgi:hypothetical protein